MNKRPPDADANEDFSCIFCGKDVNAEREIPGRYLYCSDNCAIEDPNGWAEMARSKDKYEADEKP
jgi:endogenous inhibitor of DNA gyrase (YacG/DUF329 family)